MKTYPKYLIYGTATPDLRFRMAGEVVFCRNNETLHLSDADFVNGTFQAGRFLSRLCSKHCRPHRKWNQPCPAFVEKYGFGKKTSDLATVTARAVPDLSQCPGFRNLIEMPRTTAEERYLVRAYYADHVADEMAWRETLVSDWNQHWNKVPSDVILGSRRDTFDRGMWATVRYPALIPQVWLNWLNATEQDKILEENPSRVDFIAFYAGRRHAVEIDGPSHYASYDEQRRTYTIDEREYARNLKIARSLQKQQWQLTRIARIEVRDAIAADETSVDSEDVDWEALGLRHRLLRILPFPRGYAEKPDAADYGWEEVASAALYASASVDDDIPF